MSPEGSEKRRSSRVKRRINATFQVGEKSWSGIAMSFSEWGMFLQTRNLLPLRTTITVTLSVKPGQDVSVTGVVKRSRNDQPLGTGISYGGLGIEIANPSKGYLDFLKEYKP